MSSLPYNELSNYLIIITENSALFGKMAEKWGGGYFFKFRYNDFDQILLPSELYTDQSNNSISTTILSREKSIQKPKTAYSSATFTKSLWVHLGIFQIQFSFTFYERSISAFISGLFNFKQKILAIIFHS